MATNFPSHDLEVEEEYIDMEVSSYSVFVSSSDQSPPSPRHRDFEFQMCANSLVKEATTTSPADELFYKGKLLPLYLPPRFEMEEKLLESDGCHYEEFYGTPSMTPAPATPTAMSTPLDSCTVSPCESFRISDEYFREFSAEMTDLSSKGTSKKSWTRRFKLIKQSLSKLKATRAYVNVLLGKWGCSNDSCTDAAKSYAFEVSDPFRDHCDYSTKRSTSSSGRVPRVVRGCEEEKASESGGVHHGRLSSAVSSKRPLPKNKTSTSSFSLSSSSSNSSSSSLCSSDSSRFSELRLPKRSCHVYAEIESPIQGAIAYCKQSQNLF